VRQQRIVTDTRPRVVVLNDFPPGYYADVPQALAPLDGRAEIVVHDRLAESSDELADWLAGAYAAIDIRAKSTIDAALLARLPELRVLVVRGTMAPLIDVDEATRRGILVCNTPYQSTEAVSEFALGLVFAALRRIPLMDRRMRRGEWQSDRGFVLRGRRLGVVGLGMIGQAMCRLGAGIGMEVVAWTQTPDPERAASCGATLCDLDTLMQTSDVISVHLRLSSRSRGLLGRRELFLMKPGAVFVNTARAGLLDEQALIELLQEGRVCAGLDVFATEPLPTDHPLTKLDNVVLAPHAAWATDDVYVDRALVPVQNVASALVGAPQNVMNPAALEHPHWQIR
jgi:phosphoglycerate dehydrogenase-like enzyme